MIGTERAVGLLAIATIALAALAPTRPAHAAEPDAKPRRVTVVGFGRERGAADVAELRFAVEQIAPTAEAAAQGAAKISERVLAALKKDVGPGGKVETAGFTLNPNYRPEPPQSAARERGPQIVSYTAMNEVRVQTRRVDAVGALIDAGITAGAGRINQLSFAVEDPAPLQARALATAAADAAAQAATIAAALHVRLTNVLEATTESVARPLPQQYSRAMLSAEGAMAQTPIEPGTIATDASLRVTYGIE
jgi:uncharacterized protein YggE